MARIHARDIHSIAARAAQDASTLPSASGSLLKRGARLARAILTTRDCVTSANINTCEKPVASSDVILGILIGAGVFLFLVVMIVLYFLHLRRKRRDKAEFANDPHELSDYGLDDPTLSTKKGGLSAPQTKQKRLSAQELMGAENPFGNGAELADSDRVAAKEREASHSPPRYPGDAHVKM